MEWLTILDRYGWPSFILLVMGVFFWKGLWPVIIAQIKTAEDRNARSEARCQHLTDQFLDALKEERELRINTHEASLTELRRLADKLP